MARGRPRGPQGRRQVQVGPQVDQERAIHHGQDVGRLAVPEHDLVGARPVGPHGQVELPPGAGRAGSRTRANAAATGSRGSRSGTHAVWPGPAVHSVNSIRGRVASSKPAWASSRAAVASVGDLRPCS